MQTGQADNDPAWRCSNEEKGTSEVPSVRPSVSLPSLSRRRSISQCLCGCCPAPSRDGRDSRWQGSSLVLLIESAFNASSLQWMGTKGTNGMNGTNGINGCSHQQHRARAPGHIEFIPSTNLNPPKHHQASYQCTAVTLPSSLSLPHHRRCHLASSLVYIHCLCRAYDSYQIYCRKNAPRFPPHHGVLTLGRWPLKRLSLPTYRTSRTPAPLDHDRTHPLSCCSSCRSGGMPCGFLFVTVPQPIPPLHGEMRASAAGEGQADCYAEKRLEGTTVCVVSTSTLRGPRTFDESFP